MWSDLVDVAIPLSEKVLRTVLIYGALLVLLRLAGKRNLAEFNTFDLVVMLLLANVVQNAVIGPDYSLLGGVIGAGVLIAVNAVLVRLATVVPGLRNLFEGHAVVLAEGGKMRTRTLRWLGIRPAEIAVAIRRQGGHHIHDTQSVVLEPGGVVVVRLKGGTERATHADLVEVNERLARIERALEHRLR